jgi:hypothetical protein
MRTSLYRTMTATATTTSGRSAPMMDSPEFRAKYMRGAVRKSEGSCAIVLQEVGPEHWEAGRD